MKKSLRVLKYTSMIFIIVVTVLLSARAILLMPKVWLADIANKQTFGMAVHMSAHPKNEGLYVITDKLGKIYSFKELGAEKRLIGDISSKIKSDTTEEGLLSALYDIKDPSFIYLYYSFDNPHGNRLSRFKIGEDGLIIDNSEEVILEFMKPHTGHNGGDMKFGEDGNLWLSIGDGGYVTKKQSAKLKSVILGSIIRINLHDNIKTDEKYSIPADNPFVGNEKGIPEEVWAMGLRNPWRWSFVDDKTVIVGDVGQRRFEEISIVKAGDHLGWPWVEGPKCARHVKKCDLKKYKKPMTYFSRRVLRSITGGLYYRGENVALLKGKYLFGDYLRGVMTLPGKNPPEKILEVIDSGFSTVFPKIPISFGPDRGTSIHPVSFFEDKNKEVIVVSLNGGIFRIEEISFYNRMRSFLYMVGSLR